jgi:hypothetical protein
VNERRNAREEKKHCERAYAPRKGRPCSCKGTLLPNRHGRGGSPIGCNSDASVLTVDADEVSGAAAIGGAGLVAVAALHDLPVDPPCETDKKDGDQKLSDHAVANCAPYVRAGGSPEVGR